MTNPEPETCPVCYEELEGKMVITTICNHRFCFDCLEQWMNSMNRRWNNCPLCRCCLRPDFENELNEDGEIIEVLNDDEDEMEDEGHLQRQHPVIPGLVDIFRRMIRLESVAPRIEEEEPLLDIAQLDEVIVENNIGPRPQFIPRDLRPAHLPYVALIPNNIGGLTDFALRAEELLLLNRLNSNGIYRGNNQIRRLSRVRELIFNDWNNGSITEENFHTALRIMNQRINAAMDDLQNGVRNEIIG